tara:strand:+ start:106 stop:498 length:393 start_codon:yes stop_codon:yes gene_type:complete
MCHPKHDAPSAATCIDDDEQLETLLKAHPIKPFLIQFGSPKCERCPAYGDAINVLSKSYDFLWLYCNTHTYDGVLIEKYGITRLPAFVFGCDTPSIETQVGQAEPARAPYKVEAVVRASLTPSLSLDADF